MKRLLAVLTLLLCFNVAHAQSPQELKKQADAAWDEKSYSRALDLYRQAKGAGLLIEAEDVDYRIAVALGETQKWDEAIKAGEYQLDRTHWKARVLYYLGRLYTKLPHQGYKVGGKTYRGEDYPKIEGAEKPEQVYLGEEDAAKALDYLKQAKVQAQIERDKAMHNRYFAPIYPLPWDQEIDLNFDLAAMIPQRDLSDFITQLEKGQGGDENVDLKVPYDPKWSMPKEVLYLYNEIPTLDQADNNHDSALALLSKGLFVNAYHQRMEEWAWVWSDAQKKQIHRDYPFQKLEGVSYWRELVEKYPRDPIADRTQLLIAQSMTTQSAALVEYRKLLDLFPKSKYANDAQAAIQNILRKEVTFSLSERAKPGENVKIQAGARNVKTVAFAAYKVKLEDWLANPERLAEWNTYFTSFTSNFGAVGDARQKFGAPVASWTWQTGDKGDYQGQSEQIKTPLSDIGAYVVVASAGTKRFAGLVLISDLAILKKTDRDGAFAFVADAKSGAPINGADVILKEWYYRSSGANMVSLARGRSDDAGIFEKKLVREHDSYSNQVAAFAWVGDRYAVTGNNYYGYGNYGDNRDELKILSYTDRPVYRPAQKVYFRQILTQRIGGGDLKPSVGTTVHVSVTNPKGENVWAKDLVTGEFGTINADFNLPAETPLGEYSINAGVDKTARNIQASGSSRFRVEEYKRPEFEVTVTAPKEAKRPGETVAARINARYYFGSPVPNATVKYTVRRSVWWASFRFPQKFDWLYSYWGAGDYDTGRRNIGGEGSGAIVKEGTVKTDAQGNAELTFETKANDETGDSWYRYYANPLYTIEAEVTEASRRTIEAQGQVKVADQQYFAFLNVERGYFLQNDRVQVELATRDANDQPLAAAGSMAVYKLLPGDKEEKVFQEPVQTDAQGRVFWNWEAKDSGQFRVAYLATDAWGHKVEASTSVWVVGAGLNNTQIRLRGVTILLDKRYYEEGQTVRALLVADKPGATVLFTQEAGGEILRRDVFTIPGKSREVAIPVEHNFVPNFFLAVALVQDYEVYQAQQEVFVPPVRELLNVSVSADKNEYKPGETGKFTLKATDWRGQPARAEVSLSLIDASLFYIQKDYAPDMRAFYYGERRANSVNLDSYRSGNFENRGEDDERYQNYETHGWDMPDDLGQLNLPPGGFGYYPGYYRSRGGMGGGGFGREELAMDSENGAVPAMAAMAPAPVATSGRLEMKSRSDVAQTQAAPEIRSNFAETAVWAPAVVTEGGQASVEVKFPDSLTQWHATARGLTTDVQVGAAETDVATKKNLLVRLQAPRFFVERDEVVLSANVHNYSKSKEKITLNASMSDELEWTGKSGLAPIELASGEEKRVDWKVKVVREGQAGIQISAQTATDSDGVRMSFPVLVHGIQRFAAQSGTLPGNGKTVVKIDFPKERRFGASQLNLQMNPSLAAQMLDALPYLADYPYGCVEQTMSRFLPSVVTVKTLREAGIDLDTLRKRAEAYEAEAQAKPIGERVAATGYTYPKGMPNSRDFNEMSSHLWYTNRARNPIFDAAEMQKMVDEGLSRLYSMQRDDGGWGWWAGSGHSDEYMSAYVVYGLATANASDVAVRGDVLERGYNYLNRQMKDEDNIHLLTYIAYALSQRGKLSDDTLKIAAGRLFEQRERLTAYSKSLLAMALWNGGEKEKAGVLVRNLENTAVVDASNGTARWKMAPSWWCWWNNDIETNAVALRAFNMVDPQNKLTPFIMKWLTLKSRGNHWTSTKETAEAVYSLAAFVRTNKELDVDYTLKVNLNGQLARTYHVTRDNALFFDNRFVTGDLFLENGANTVTIEKSGRGNLYWNAYSEYFSLEEPIKASGNEIAIKRRYFKLTRVAQVADSPSPAARLKMRPMPAQPVGQEYKRTEIKDGEVLTSGDLVEVELTLDSKNDYSYLVFEDMKPAGLEPVDLRSGSAYGDGLSSNVELRDEKVAFFVDNLPQGTRVLRYRMRTEIPGTFHALPTNGYAMYAPEVRAISDEMRLGVKD